MAVSLPLWERGLKFLTGKRGLYEISVAPLVGAWIEIDIYGPLIDSLLSLPLWERGLKYVNISIGGLADRRSPRGSVD